MKAELGREGIGILRVTVQRARAYGKPGTYFAVLRATTQRQADANSPYGRVQNLARVRVVVE